MCATGYVGSATHAGVGFGLRSAVARTMFASVDGLLPRSAFLLLAATGWLLADGRPYGRLDPRYPCFSPWRSL